MASALFIDKLALVLVRDRKQLVARSRGKTAFFTPGGKREAGESDEAALRRECREELSVELIDGTIEPYGVFQAQAHGKPEGTMVRMTCFTADYDGTLTANDEVAAHSALARLVLTAQRPRTPRLTNRWRSCAGSPQTAHAPTSR
mmetsp:Transcript_30307/g.101297  ORF Transcript_30307/g.101297 Transcript_30307/m.101297 type:complete len:145 (-) Transcript_30307:512-946(-)